jgi:hypothetical protein
MSLSGGTVAAVGDLAGDHGLTSATDSLGTQ